MEKVAEPADQCAENQGLYEAQDAAWLAAGAKSWSKKTPTRAQTPAGLGHLENPGAPGIASF